MVVRLLEARDVPDRVVRKLAADIVPVAPRFNIPHISCRTCVAFTAADARFSTPSFT